MIRQPPRSTLFPYPPLFRSLAEEHQAPGGGERAADQGLLGVVLPRDLAGIDVDRREAAPLLLARYGLECAAQRHLKRTRLNASHCPKSYAAFCLRKKTTTDQ